ncbi:hypothetical protein [Streptomyces sp. NPDC058295]|uniref:hypothetical protein n=1 Tax=Streptomyces sp. NPDC058295 TaxID=3346431 RepID=UPI0036EA169A
MAAIGDYEQETAQLLAAAVAETVDNALRPQLRPLVDQLAGFGEDLSRLPQAIGRVRTAVDAVPTRLADAVERGTAQVRQGLEPQERLLHDLNDRLALLVDRMAALEERLEAQETARCAGARSADDAREALATRLATLRRYLLIGLPLAVVAPVAVLIMLFVDSRS